MKLVIAEKPSVAMSLAAVLGAKGKKDGYAEGNDWIVSWCVGHLMKLAQPEAYDARYAKWDYADLPICPDEWKYDVPKDKKKQLDILCRLMNDRRVDTVVCATDAGREGELIFRLVYGYAGCTKPVKRLWISSMEDAAIRDGFANLRPGSDFDLLHEAASCRAQADWLVGINATRLFSLLYGVTLNMGRVMMPTLAMVAEREKQISGFVSKDFFIPEIDCGEFIASGERYDEKEKAARVCLDCDGSGAEVRSVTRQTKGVKPPLLYDLTTLQRESSRIFGYTAQQTLDYLQSLYEKKLVTYPRTDSRYLTEDMRETAEDLTVWLREHTIYGKSCEGEADVSRLINGEKVSDHHALLPTAEIKKSGFETLPAGERDVLSLVFKRLLEATAQPYLYETAEAVLECKGHTFTAKGKTVKQAGWKKVEQIFRAGLKKNPDEREEEKEDAALPPLADGQNFFPVSASVRQGKTTPPKHYTEDMLLAAMETAGAEEMPEDAERKGLGTPATRAGTLEKLVSVGFLRREKRQLLPTEKGMNLIAVAPEEIASPKLTAEWESDLKRVERGEYPAEDFMRGITDMLRALVKEYSKPEEEYKTLFHSAKSGREAVGTCPRCGAPVYEREKGFFCDNRDCSFVLWKKNSFFSKKKARMTRTVAATLLKEGRIFMKGLYSEKTGKTYDAYVILDDTGEKYVNFKLAFPAKTGGRK